MGGAVGTDATRLVRDADQPVAQDRRYRRGRADRRPSFGRGWPAAADRRRQHLRVAGPATAADDGCRHRVPLGDQVPRRPLGCRARCRRHLGRRDRGAPALPPERDGRGPRAARFLPRAPRPSHAPPAGRATPGQRPGRRRVPSLARRPRRRPLSGPERDGVLHPARRAARRRPQSGRSRSPRGRACSRWPSRSEASSRSSRCRLR